MLTVPVNQGDGGVTSDALAGDPVPLTGEVTPVSSQLARGRSLVVVDRVVAQPERASGLCRQFIHGSGPAGVAVHLLISFAEISLMAVNRVGIGTYPLSTPWTEELREHSP
jgi:hypothetical protein